MKVLVKEESNIPASIYCDLPCYFDEWAEIGGNWVLDILCKTIKLMKNLELKATISGEKYLIALRDFTYVDKDSAIRDINGKYTTLTKLVLSAKKIKLVDSTGVEIVRFRKNC